ncbi:hypothetical protein [Geminisphaera colitermitum]|uniref:hypothetical protein n=1 Tax=Geminisphaera colitermitum TaxID=1148786 RepID=UPI000158CA94|nr:hypothetical protein [Geminisphaera colitermitum]
MDTMALRRVARIAWENRERLELNPNDTEQVLIAWMAVGTNDEAEAASALLAAIREADRKQATFDRLLQRTPAA